MTLPQNVKDADEEMVAAGGEIIWRHYPAIRAHLLSQEAEIERLQSRLAAANERLEAAPIATGSQLARGIRPGDYAVPWDWPVTSMTKVRLIAIDAAAQEGKG